MQNASSLPSLRSRVLRAGVWTLGGHAAAQIIRLGGNLIIARLLVPEMFGLMALAQVLIVGLNLFSDFGLHQNIVRHRQGDDPAYLNTVWTLQIIRGLVICIMALGLAFCVYWFGQLKWWPEASVYSDPLLPFVIGALSINVVIASLASTKFASASRALTLGGPTLIAIVSQIVGLSCMIAWAMFDRSIWALAAGALVSTAMSSLLSHISLAGSQNRTLLEPRDSWRGHRARQMGTSQFDPCFFRGKRRPLTGWRSYRCHHFRALFDRVLACLGDPGVLWPAHRQSCLAGHQRSG